MKEIKTEIIIDASPELVWQVLTDFESYPDWNPFLVSIEGDKEVGGRLTNKMVSNGKTNVFKPTILTWEENQHFEWLGSLPLRLFTGRHYFILEAINAQQTKLIHGEKFGGLLRAMIMKQIGETTLQNFLAMNRALKQQVESKVEIGK
ncbi:MAG: SRPBCC domain-containing protein [Bacteroidota bacterium]